MTDDKFDRVRKTALVEGIVIGVVLTLIVLMLLVVFGVVNPPLSGDGFVEGYDYQYP